MRTIFEANPFSGSHFLGQPPLARMPVSLGQALDPEDIRALQKMDPEDLVTLGRVLSCGRIIATNEGVTIVTTVVRTVNTVFEILGLKKPDEMIQASEDARKSNDYRGQVIGRSADVGAALDAVADAIIVKKPEWQVTYHRWSGEIIVKTARNAPENPRIISLEPPDQTLGGALKYADEHLGITERLQEASRLGNPFALLQVLGVIIGLALIVLGVFLVLNDQRQKWLERLGREMATKQAENDRDRARVAVIDAKGTAATTDEQTEKRRLEEDIRRRQAEIQAAERAAKELREAGGIISEVIRALGIAPIIQGILIGSGIILLTGLAIWVFGKGPAAAAPARS